MPEVNQVANLVSPNGQGAQIPWDVRQKMLAGELAQQQAAAPKAPYSSRAAGAANALQGLLGGLMEGAATQQVTQGQDENRQHMAMLLSALKSGTALGGAPAGGAAQGAAPASATPAGATPMGQGGVGSDHVASKSHADFIASIMPEAQRISAQTGIDARLIAAQAAHESNFGKSAPGGNLFGIKGPGTGPISTTESVNGVMTPTKASFATYDSPSASFDGYGKLMSGNRYAGVRNGQGLDEQLAALGKSRYATDPNYAAKVGAIARGIQAPSAAPNGATSAQADMPAPNARPVSSSSLPPGVTPGMVSAPPASDGSVRGDLLAAAAQHGGLDPDAPAPNATPTGMAGLPPGVTPAMFAASQNTATDGNALHRNDEIPAGTKPYVPGSTPGPVTASGLPHQLAPGAGARADSVIGAGIGGGPADMKPSPAADPSGYLDPEGTGADNYDPNAGPSLRDQIAAAMNKGPDLGTVQPAVVPPPTTAGAPPQPAVPSILPPPKPLSGLGTAAPAVVPPPQGDLTAPPAPQDPPSSDGSVRGDLLAAASAHGMDVAGSPIVPPPQGDLMAAPAGPAPDPVGVGLSAGQDVAMDPVVPAPRGSMMPPAPSSPNVDLDGPQSDAAMGNAAPDAGPSLRDTIAAQFGNGAGTSGPQSDAAAPLAASGTDQSAGPAPIAALGATPDAPPSGPAPTLAGGPSGGPSASPGGPSLPLIASAGTPGPTPMPPQPGTGAALPSAGPMPPPGAQTLAAGGPSLPQTGPMPPPGAQTLAAAGANPDAPAPNAVPAGPQPVSPQMLAALGGPQFGGSGTNAPSGNSAAVDPSSPQNFMRAEAARAAGNGPTPGGFFDSIAGAGTPARGQGAPGSGMLGMGGPVLGGPAQQPPAPQPGGAPVGSQGGGAPMQGGGGSMAGGAGQPPAAAPGGSAPATGSAPSSAGYQQGTSDQARALAQQIMTSRFATPQQQEFAMKVLAPSMSYQKLDNGDIVAINPLTNQMSTVAHGGKFAATKNGVIYNEGSGLGVDGQPIGGSNSYRPMTPAELQSYGITDGRPAYIGPGGEPHFGMPGAAGQGETEEAKKSGEAAAGRKNDMIAAANTAPEKIARLKLLGQVLDNTATGPLAPEIGNAGAIATRLGTSPDRLTALGVDPNQAVNNAIANKLAGEMTMSSIGAKNGGMPASNFSVAERQFIEGLYPNIENQAGGNRAVTDVLTAVEQKKMQWADAWSNYKDQQAQAGKPLSYENFEDSFRRAHSQDNIFAPIMQKYQAGGYTPTAPNPGGVPGSAPGGQSQGGAPSTMQQPAPAVSAAPQPQGQGGGYLPGAARGPVPAAPQGQGAPPPQQGGQPSQRPGAPAPADAIAQAQAAIAKGAPRATVMQRLQSMGINTAGM